MENQEPMCPVCSAAMKYIPAGVSKRTRKPYAAFWGCTTYGCKGTVRIPAEGANPPQNAPQASTGRPMYDSFPKKDIKTTMDYKARQISGFQDDKQESMRLFSSGRDAVLMVTTQAEGNLTEDQLKEKVKEWRDWFYKNIYNMTDDEYKSLNTPF